MECALSSKVLPHTFWKTDLDPNLTFHDYLFSFGKLDLPEKIDAKDIYPVVRKVKSLEPGQLYRWVKANKVEEWLGEGNLETLSQRITDAVHRVFSKKCYQLSLPAHIQVEGDDQIDSEDSSLKSPQVLYSKLCKEGRQLKFALNFGEKRGKGARLKVYRVMEVVLTKGKVDFELRPKALMVHKRKGSRVEPLSPKGERFLFLSSGNPTAPQALRPSSRRPVIALVSRL